MMFAAATNTLHGSTKTGDTPYSAIFDDALSFAGDAYAWFGGSFGCDHTRQVILAIW